MRWILALAVLFLAAPARAETFAGDSFYEAEAGPWEFGLDVGMIYPTRKATFTHSIDNAKAYDLLAAESVGDEVAEGWVAPPLPGRSIVAATMKPIAELGLHAYRRLSPWLAWGLEGAYGFTREPHVDNSGVYDNAHFMKLIYTANMAHLAAPARVGPKLGRVRPYLQAGPGAYLVSEKVRIGFTDADDPQLKPVQIAGQSSLRFGLQAGAGFDWHVGERGLIGAGCQYHKVFAGPDHVDFLEPKLRFSVLF